MSASDDKIRKAADGLARRAYEHGGADAVKRSAALREAAIRDLERKQKAKES